MHVQVVCEVLVRALDSSSAAASQQSHPQPLLPTALATPAVSALRALGGVGYAYRLTAGNGVVVTASGDEAPREPVTASLALPGSEVREEACAAMHDGGGQCVCVSVCWGWGAGCVGGWGVRGYGGCWPSGRNTKCCVVANASV